MPRAPKKYADAERTTVTEEWKDWRVQQKAEDAERTKELLADLGQDPATYYPEDYDKDLGDGAWILVIDPPQSVGGLDFDVPVLSMWWARPHRLSSGKIDGRQPYQGIIATPAGDLHLWPHEYSICRDPQALIGEEGTQLHSLGGAAVLDEDQLWYLQSRGVPRHEAVMMLFSQIQQPNFVYATFPPEIVDALVGAGTRWGSTVAERWFASRDEQSAA